MIRHHRIPHGLELAGIGALAALCLGQVSCNVYYAPWEEACVVDSEEPGVPPPVLQLGSTVQAATPPPPISGGTLAMSPNMASPSLTWIVAADPEADQVHITRLDLPADVQTVALGAGDEPGRVIVDSEQRAHVALRRGGAVVSIDLATASILGRHEVCPAPRGLAHDGQTGNLLVACLSGELVTLNPLTGAVVAEQRLETGLRDVVIDRVDPDTIYVSKFRTAEVLVVDRQGGVVERMKPPSLETAEVDFATGVEVVSRFEPAVAWRTVAAPGGGVAMVHQRARVSGVSISRGGYGGDDCQSGIVHGAVTQLRPGVAPMATQAWNSAVLPVDLAVGNNAGSNAVIVAAGNKSDFFGAPSVTRVSVDEPHQPGCRPQDRDFDTQQNQAVATAVSADFTTVVVQLRDPARLAIYPNNDLARTPEIVTLDGVRRNDTGHTIFHMNSGGGIACASCHPEGGDDARVWEFDCLGPRRTQSLHVGLSGTEPFHWSGDMASFDMLMNEVFTGRMGGGQADPGQIDALASWLDSLQPPARAQALDTAAVERGQQMFQDPAVGCQTCHSGAKLTNNQSFDVGTGGTFQVPSLIGIAYRAPFIHTGCAPTLRDRFSNPDCGGGDSHGVVSTLTEQQIDDLVAYLETL